jgi:hypothetical protein
MECWIVRVKVGELRVVGERPGPMGATLAALILLRAATGPSAGIW